MRGDSLRDLYAKALALLGLALLAGVGALVDYWPAARPFPDVASLKLNRQPHAPSARVVDVVALSVATPRVRRASRGAVRPVAAGPAIASVPLDVLPATGPMPAAAFIALGEPPPAPEVVPVVATRIAALEIDLPAAPFADVVIGPLPPDAPLSGAQSNGFFSGATSAFKKTGESIVNTTVKTGASILKAFGIVGGAFRKVI